MKLKTRYIVMWFALATGILAACNSETSSYETTDTYTTTSTLIEDFSLKANTAIAKSLDSIHFTIDQDRALIYNADSLPVGTDVTRLCIDLSIESSVRSVQIHVKNGKVMKDSTFVFTSTTNDSIDFTGDVTITTTSRDNMFTRDYTVKVNVHKTEPDTLYWPMNARRDLPGATMAPDAQRVVRQGDRYFSLVEQAGSYRFAVADTPDGTWQMAPITLTFTPRVESFTASDNALYILSTEGTLYTSTNEGATWTECGVVWHHIVGSYQDKVLGVFADGDTYRHDEYPRPDGFVPAQVEDAFPIAEASPLALATYRWSERPQAMMVGGVTAKGNVTNAVWGYDGTSWAQISLSKNVLPALRGAVLIPYYTYATVSSSYIPKRFDAWLVMGGRLANGAMNTTVYSSLDQGLRWAKGATCLQLPDYFTPTASAQALVSERDVTDGATTWQCPFIYYYGGRDAGGYVVNNAWQGVYNRLFFKPIY